MYSIKRINKNYLHHLNKLYSECFNINTDTNSLIKKYDTSMFGESYVGYIAFDEKNNPAAYYGVFPIVLCYKNETILVAQSGDTMTSPKHQKKGLFIKLAKETYELAKELKIKLIFGFPNNNSYPGFKNKLGWTFIGKMHRFTIKTNSLPICELNSKIKWISIFYDTYVSLIIKKYKVDYNNIYLKIFNHTLAKGYI